MVANQPLTRPYSGGGGWEGGMKKLSLVEGKIITEKKLPCQWPCGGCMFHRHLTSILALNLWTLYVTRTRSKAISLKIKKLARKPITKRKKSNRKKFHWRTPPFEVFFTINGTSPFITHTKVFCFFRGAYLFSFGILLIRWWCLNGFFTKASWEDRLKKLLKLDDSSPWITASVLICCLSSFASSCCFSSGEDVTLRFYSEWSVISSAGEKSSTTSSN